MLGEYVCEYEDLVQDRVHKRLQSGRYVTLILRGDEIHCIDSSCYHMGGPLGAGDIEDIHLPCNAQNRNGVLGSVLNTAGSVFKGAARMMAGVSSSTSKCSAPIQAGDAHGQGDRQPGSEMEPTILCPWHYHRISLRTGKKYTEAVVPKVDPVTGKMKMQKAGLQPSNKVLQQIHRVATFEGKVYVEIVDSNSCNQLARTVEDLGQFGPEVAEPNPYSFDEHCAKNLTTQRTALHSKKYVWQSPSSDAKVDGTSLLPIANAENQTECAAVDSGLQVAAPSPGMKKAKIDFVATRS